MIVMEKLAMALANVLISSTITNAIVIHNFLAKTAKKEHIGAVMKIGKVGKMVKLAQNMQEKDFAREMEKRATIGKRNGEIFRCGRIIESGRHWSVQNAAVKNRDPKYHLTSSAMKIGEPVITKHVSTMQTLDCAKLMEIITVITGIWMNGDHLEDGRMLKEEQHLSALNAAARMPAKP